MRSLVASTDIKCLSYLVFAHPQLQYTFAVWDPQVMYLFDEMEKILNRDAQLIANDYHCSANNSNSIYA